MNRRAVAGDGTYMDITANRVVVWLPVVHVVNVQTIATTLRNGQPAQSHVLTASDPDAHPPLRFGIPAPFRSINHFRTKFQKYLQRIYGKFHSSHTILFSRNTIRIGDQQGWYGLQLGHEDPHDGTA